LRVIADKTKSEKSSGLSEMNAYITIPDQVSGAPLCELVVLPGRRKFWKWVDFGLSDCDRAIIVTRPRVGGSNPLDLIVWLALLVLHEVKDVLIVINNIDDLPHPVVEEFESSICKDFKSVITDNSIPYNVIVLSANPTPPELVSLSEQFTNLSKPIVESRQQ
jgi:hypothetical protein